MHFQRVIFCLFALAFSSPCMATLLIDAIRNGETDEAVESLIRSEGRLDERDTTGTTALIQAVTWGRLKVVEALAASGADLNFSNSLKWTPFQTALQMGDRAQSIQMATLLLTHGRGRVRVQSAEIRKYLTWPTPRDKDIYPEIGSRVTELLEKLPPEIIAASNLQKAWAELSHEFTDPYLL